MSKQATSFVLAYHGCDANLAKDIVLDTKSLKPSSNDHDWLGEGIYFWESDKLRAWEWADRHVKGGKFSEAAVLGAAIDLGNCLDLVSRADLELLSIAHKAYLKDVKSAGYPLPKNHDPTNVQGNDRLIRALDCAVINYLHSLIEDTTNTDFNYPKFDTVRAMFSEGKALYPGAGFLEKNHVQISVRTKSCIKGIFLAPR